MKIFLATKNRDKVREIEKALKDNGVEVLSLRDFNDLPDVVEDGDTLEYNSLKKATEIAEFIKEKHNLNLPVIADDTGLFVDALDGEPGVYSSRYAGEDCSYQDNCDKLLLEMSGKSDRKARFICLMTLADNGKTEISRGILEGSITEEQNGREGFGYDPIFLPSGYEKTLAEITLDEKNKISHRGLAVLGMVDIIKKNYNL